MKLSPVDTDGFAPLIYDLFQKYHTKKQIFLNIGISGTWYKLEKKNA